MHNGWPTNWAILPKIEKRKETGHIDTSKKKIARKFNENWTKERKWLKYDNEKQLMYCILCTKFVTSENTEEIIQLASSKVVQILKLQL